MMPNKLLLFVVFNLAFSISTVAQVRYIADTSVDTETTQIAIEAKDSKVKKVRLIFEASGNSFAKPLPESRVLFVPVALKVGTNKFNIIAYDADDNILAAETKAIVIVRSAKAIENSGGSDLGDGDSERDSSKLNRKVMDSNRQPVQEAEVTLFDKDGHLLEKQITDSNGAYRFTTPIPGPERTAAESGEKAAKEQASVPATIKVNQKEFYESELPAQAKETYLRPITGRVAGETWRAVVGYEQAGASAQNSRRNLFFDFAMSVPITPFEKFNGGITSFGPRSRIWGDVRLSSVPNPTADQMTLSKFVTGFSTIVGNTQVNQVVQAFETTAGFETRLFSTPKPFLGLFSTTKHRFSVNLVAGGGIITPLSPSDPDTKAIFQATDEARMRYGLSPDKQYIAFVSPNRDRFYREYFVGLRLKTLYFDDFERPRDIHPANLDVTFGQNEAITGGGLHGGVLRFDGFYPMPFGLRNYVYLYGTAQLKLTRAQTLEAPLFLNPAPADASLSGPNTGVVTLPTVNRDYYKIGVGVNVIKVLCNIITCGEQK
jgi:hypothetical protein